MQEITELRREGLSVVAISELTGLRPENDQEVFVTQSGRPACGPILAPSGKLEPFEPYLQERLQAGV